MAIRRIRHVYVASPDRSEGFLAAEFSDRVDLDVAIVAITPDGWTSHVDPEWAQPMYNLVSWHGEEVGHDPITRHEQRQP